MPLCFWSIAEFGYHFHPKSAASRSHSFPLWINFVACGRRGRIVQRKTRLFFNVQFAINCENDCCGLSTCIPYHLANAIFSFCYQWLLITWYRLLDWLAVQRYANIVSANFSFQFDFVSSENSKFPRHNAGACPNRSRSTRHDPSFDHRLVFWLIELTFVKISILRSLPFGYQLPIVVTHKRRVERRRKTFLISHNYE